MTGACGDGTFNVRVADYTTAFHHATADRNARSARRVVPLALSFVNPRSVVDVGCGLGTWLAAFAEAGVPDIVGVDGPSVDRSRLSIPADRFHAHDLTQPLDLGRTFDLAVCVEVAEHLPERSAARFVGDLTRLAPVVLFSAAVPGQGGTHHVNEQWPEYWAGLFLGKGYVAIDGIRPRIWNDPDVEFYYAQNLLLFAKAERLDAFPALKAEEAKRRGDPLARIHPARWRAALDPGRQHLRWLVRALWRSSLQRLRR